MSMMKWSALSLAVMTLGGACASSSGGSATATATVTTAATTAACQDVAIAGGAEDIGEVASATYGGTLGEAQGSDAKDELEHFWTLTLDRPFCKVPGQTDGPVDELQVYSADPAVDARFAGLVGQHVRVTGPGFTAHTAHHHRPIVLEAKELATP